VTGSLTNDNKIGDVLTTSFICTKTISLVISESNPTNLQMDPTQLWPAHMRQQLTVTSWLPAMVDVIDQVLLTADDDRHLLIILSISVHKSYHSYGMDDKSPTQDPFSQESLDVEKFSHSRPTLIDGTCDDRRTSIDTLTAHICANNR